MSNHKVEIHKAASLPRCPVFKKRQRASWGGGSGGMTSIFSSTMRFSSSRTWIHCISVWWAKQFRYNYSVSNWAWPFWGHFSKWLLLIQQLHSHDSSAIRVNKEKKLGETCIKQCLSWLKPMLNINGLFRNKDEDNSTSSMESFSLSSIFLFFFFFS